MAAGRENDIPFEQATLTTFEGYVKKTKKNTMVATLSIIKRTHRTNLEHGITGLLELLLYTVRILANRSYW